ncbi:hypothetical protein ACFL1H_00550 [Nanoarchaeota archaeon]
MIVILLVLNLLILSSIFIFAECENPDPDYYPTEENPWSEEEWKDVDYECVIWSEVEDYEHVNLRDIPEDGWGDCENCVDQSSIVGEKVSQIPSKYYDPTQIKKENLKFSNILQIEQHMDEFENLMDVGHEKLSRLFSMPIFNTDIDFSQANEVTFNTETGLLSDGFPTYNPKEFPKENYRQQIVGNKVILIPIINNQPVPGDSVSIAGADSFSLNNGEIDILTDEDKDTEIKGKISGTITTTSGEVINFETNNYITISDDGDIDASDSKIEIPNKIYQDYSIVVEGTFTRNNDVYTLSSFDGKHTSYDDTLNKFSTKSVGIDPVSVSFGIENFPLEIGRDILSDEPLEPPQNIIVYTQDNLKTYGIVDVSKDDIRVSSKDINSRFKSGNDIITAYGKVRYESPSLLYEGLTDSTRMYSGFIDDTEKIEIESDENGKIAELAKKYSVGSLLLDDEFIAGDYFINMDIYNDDGNYNVELDEASLLVLSNIERELTTFALIENDLVLELGNENAFFAISTDFGMRYKNSEGEAVSFLGPSSTYQLLGNDIETVKGIFNSQMKNQNLNVDLQLLELQKIYEMDKKDHTTTFDVEDLDYHIPIQFEASIDSYDGVKEFINSNVDDDLFKSTLLSSFMISNLGSIEIDSGTGDSNIMEAQRDKYESFINQNLNEIKSNNMDGFLEGYLNTHNTPDIFKVTNELSDIAFENPSLAEEYYKIYKQRFNNILSYDYLVSTLDPLTEKSDLDKENVINSYRALLHLSTTQVISTGESYSINTDPGLFSTEKVNLVEGLASFYAKEGDVGNAIFLLDDLQIDLNNYVYKLETEGSIDYNAQQVLNQLYKRLEEGRNMVAMRGFDKIQADLYIEPIIQDYLDMRKGYIDRTKDILLHSDPGNPKELLLGLGQIVFGGGFGKDIYNAMGGYDDLKSKASRLSEESRVLSEGTFALSTLTSMGVSGETIEKWLNDDLEDVELESMVNKLMLDSGRYRTDGKRRSDPEFNFEGFVQKVDKEGNPITDFDFTGTSETHDDPLFSVQNQPPSFEFEIEGGTGGLLGSVISGEGEYYIDSTESRIVYEFLEELKQDAKVLYNSPEYRDDIALLIGTRSVVPTLNHKFQYDPHVTTNFQLDIQRNKIKDKVKDRLEPGDFETVMSFVDDGLSPGAIVLTVVTAGSAPTILGSSNFLVKSGSGLLANVAIDGTTGTLLVEGLGVNPYERPELAIGTGLIASLTGPRILAGFSRTSSITADDYIRAMTRELDDQTSDVVRKTMGGYGVNQFADIELITKELRQAGVDSNKIFDIRASISNFEFGNLVKGIPATELAKVGLRRTSKGIVDEFDKVITKLDDLDNHINNFNARTVAATKFDDAIDSMKSSNNPARLGPDIELKVQKNYNYDVEFETPSRPPNSITNVNLAGSTDEILDQSDEVFNKANRPGFYGEKNIDLLSREVGEGPVTAIMIETRGYMKFNPARNVWEEVVDVNGKSLNELQYCNLFGHTTCGNKLLGKTLDNYNKINDDVVQQYNRLHPNTPIEKVDGFLRVGSKGGSFFVKGNIAHPDDLENIISKTMNDFQDEFLSGTPKQISDNSMISGMHATLGSANNIDDAYKKASTGFGNGFKKNGDEFGKKHSSSVINVDDVDVDNNLVLDYTRQRTGIDVPDQTGLSLRQKYVQAYDNYKTNPTSTNLFKLENVVNDINFKVETNHITGAPNFNTAKQLAKNNKRFISAGGEENYIFNKEGKMVVFSDGDDFRQLNINSNSIVSQKVSDGTYTLDEIVAGSQVDNILKKSQDVTQDLIDWSGKIDLETINFVRQNVNSETLFFSRSYAMYNYQDEIIEGLSANTNVKRLIDEEAFNGVSLDTYNEMVIKVAKDRSKNGVAVLEELDSDGLTGIVRLVNDKMPEGQRFRVKFDPETGNTVQNVPLGMKDVDEFIDFKRTITSELDSAAINYNIKNVRVIGSSATGVSKTTKQPFVRGIDHDYDVSVVMTKNEFDNLVSDIETELFKDKNPETYLQTKQYKTFKKAVEKGKMGKEWLNFLNPEKSLTPTLAKKAREMDIEKIQLSVIVENNKFDEKLFVPFAE